MRWITLAIFFLMMLSMIGSVGGEEIYLEENDTLMVEYENLEDRPKTIQFDDVTKQTGVLTTGEIGFVQDLQSSYVDVTATTEITDMSIQLTRRPMDNETITINTEDEIDVIVTRFEDDQITNRTILTETDPEIDMIASDSFDDRYEIRITDPQSYRGVTTERSTTFSVLQTGDSNIGLVVVVIILILVALFLFLLFRDREDEYY